MRRSWWRIPHRRCRWRLELYLEALPWPCRTVWRLLSTVLTMRGQSSRPRAWWWSWSDRAVGLLGKNKHCMRSGQLPPVRPRSLVINVQVVRLQAGLFPWESLACSGVNTAQRDEKLVKPKRGKGKSSSRRSCRVSSASHAYLHADQLLASSGAASATTPTVRAICTWTGAITVSRPDSSLRTPTLLTPVDVERAVSWQGSYLKLVLASSA